VIAESCGRRWARGEKDKNGGAGTRGTREYLGVKWSQRGVRALGKKNETQKDLKMEAEGGDPSWSREKEET